MIDMDKEFSSDDVQLITASFEDFYVKYASWPFNIPSDDVSVTILIPSILVDAKRNFHA